MKNIYVFGTSPNFAQAIAENLLDDPRYKFLGYTLNARFCGSNEVHNFPLVPFEELAKKGDGFAVINCIGYSDMLKNRENVAEMITETGFKLEGYIHPTAIIMPGVEIGEGNIIMAGAYIGNRVKIGNGNIIAPCSHTEVGGIVGSYNFFAPQSTRLGPVFVGNHCILGGNSTIKNGVTIADYTIVSAGSYITTDTKEYGVYVREHTRRVRSVNSLDFVYNMK
jgi:carbonic anhydrase/acetyltransferase-like protein (isoleucine patch superfamily)